MVVHRERKSFRFTLYPTTTTKINSKRVENFNVKIAINLKMKY